MGRIGKTVALAAAMLAFAGSPSVQRVDLTSGPVIVTTPTKPAQQQQPAPQQTSARDELRRVAESFAIVHRHRRQWDGKNRTSGDRAHKRLKHRRRAGR